MFQHGRIPYHDIYAAANPSPWINLHWMFQGIVYWTHRAAGAWGLDLLKTACVSLTYLLLFLAGSGRSRPVLAGWILFFSALTAGERFQIRPELFTFLFMACHLYVLERWSSHGRDRLLWILPVVQVLWTNMEGLFMIGPGIVAMYLVESLLNKRNCRVLIAVFAASLSACLVNPYGVAGFLFPLSLLSEVVHKNRLPSGLVGEFLPLFSAQTAMTLKVLCGSLLAAGAGSMILKARGRLWSHVLLFLVFAGLALAAQRNAALYAVAFPVIVLARIPPASGPPKRWIRPCAASIFALANAALIFSALTNQLYIKTHRYERFGAGFAPEIFSSGALNFLIDMDRKIRVFHPLDLGPVLILKAWPALTPFIDTRLEVCGRERLTEYVSAFQSAQTWKTLDDKHKFEAVWLDHFKKDSLSLIRLLSKDLGWSLAYFDEWTAVFLKRNVKETVIAVDGRGRTPERESPYVSLRRLAPFLPPEVSYPSEEIYLGRFFLAMGDYSGARDQYRRILKQLPALAEAWINLAYVEEMHGNEELAIAHLTEALKHKPRSYQAHFNLGTLLMKRGRFEDAVLEFETALKLRPTPQARHSLETALNRRRSGTD